MTLDGTSLSVPRAKEGREGDGVGLTTSCLLSS